MVYSIRHVTVDELMELVEDVARVKKGRVRCGVGSRKRACTTHTFMR